MSSEPDLLFPDESLPEGSVVDGLTLERDAVDEFDFVVVGSGAAGLVAAHTLATTGCSVAVVEEGPWVRTRDFGESVYGAFQRMFREVGTQVVEGRLYMPLLQGRCAGGSTVMNSAIAHRTPEDVLADWAETYGLRGALSARALEPHFEALERDLGVRAVSDEALGENSRLFLREAAAQALPAARMHRYEEGCRGSARCFTGCPSGAKHAMNVTYLPWALRLGARAYTSCAALRVLVERGRAVGVVARATVGGRRRVTLRARRGVLVAASAVQTPNLLRRSGLRSRAIGRDFQCHPGLSVAGLFDDPVDIGVGATQGAESLSLRRTDRIKLETLSLPLELAAVRIPGVGRELMRRFGDFSGVAIWAVVVRAAAHGTVDSTWAGRDRVSLSLTPLDVERARKGATLLARMMFEAGAREVWPGVFGVPPVLSSADDVPLLERASLDPRAYGFITSHLFGSARMGREARESVVGPDFQAHELPGLYLIDSSVFPTNLGVNPQHTIMAVSRLAATRIVEARSSPARAA